MIKQSGSILGELDHPEGRFDIQLKEASHKITDLWYDQENHNVMGKLEILDTPNGKIAQELVEAGYPLFVSSRAAGDVDEKHMKLKLLKYSHMILYVHQVLQKHVLIESMNLSV